MPDPSYPGLDDSWFDRGRPPPLTRAAVMAELARRTSPVEDTRDVMNVDPADPDVEVDFADSFFDR